MIEIVVLKTFEMDVLRQIAPGYTSATRYTVSKIETPAHTSFNLDLIELDTAFVKRWEWDDSYTTWYRSVVDKGASFLALENGVPVGIAIADPQQWNRVLNVCEIHVAESVRGRGIGRLLIEKLTGVARERELRAIVCETQNTNVPAIGFYRAVGFKIDGIDLSYYTNTDITDFEVAIFMKLKLH